MRSNRETWKTRVKAWRASGKTAPEFAAEHGLEASTLRWWASQLRHEPASSAHVQLARVEVVAASAASALVVEVGAARIEVRDGFDRALLRDVVSALGGAR